MEHALREDGLRQERQKDLEVFKNEIKKLSEFYDVETLDDYVYIIHGKKRHERAQVSVMGLTHGNELAGFSIIFEFISHLRAVKPVLPFSVGVALGNIEAYKEDKRFLECDLNRSFASKEFKFQEQRRAACLSKLLLRTDFFIDFHQTQRPCLKPFFIFPYTKRGLFLAANLSRDIPIVTHFSGGFSKDGLCTDEYLNAHGGTGISVETGYCGKDPLQIAFGLKLIFRALFVDIGLREDKEIILSKISSFKNLSLYSWSEVCLYPEKSLVSLKEDLLNFSFVKKGSSLGLCEGHSVKSKEDGYLLFPKYIKKGEPRPKELFRLVKKITYKNLPEFL